MLSLVQLQHNIPIGNKSLLGTAIMDSELEGPPEIETDLQHWEGVPLSNFLLEALKTTIIQNVMVDSQGSPVRCCCHSKLRVPGGQLWGLHASLDLWWEGWGGFRYIFTIIDFLVLWHRHQTSPSWKECPLSFSVGKLHDWSQQVTMTWTMADDLQRLTRIKYL